MQKLSFEQIDRLTGGRIGTHDVPCPNCREKFPGPKADEQKLRIWRNKPDFAGYKCFRCDTHGSVRSTRRATPEEKARAEAEYLERAADDARVRSRRERDAVLKWKTSRFVDGTLAETYLRQFRGYAGPFPPSLGFLPAWREEPARLLAAFQNENDDQPTGIRVTALTPDGNKAASPMNHGRVKGSPIVIARTVAGQRLAVCEGVEDGLSIFQALGCPVWVSGGATFLPALAPSCPEHVASVLVVSDPDESGVSNAMALVVALLDRGIPAEFRIPRHPMK